MLKNIGRSILLVGLVLLVSGCYETDQEIIMASEAAKVYGLPGTYTSRSATTRIWEVPGTDDYRFEELDVDGVSSGYLRAVPLRGNIYLAQAKYDNGAIYLLFYEFIVSSGGASYHPLEATEDVGELARRHNVTMELDEMSGYFLKGRREDIKAFLLAHRDLDFFRASDF